MIDMTTGFSERDILQLMIALLLHVSGIAPTEFGTTFINIVEVPELEPSNSRHPRICSNSSRFHPYRRPTASSSSHSSPRHCVECASVIINPYPPYKCAECGSINTNRFGYNPRAQVVAPPPRLPAILTNPPPSAKILEVAASDSPESPQATSPIATLPVPELPSFRPSATPDYEYSVAAEEE